MNSYRRNVFIGILTVLLSMPFLTAGNARADDPYEENDDSATAWHPGYDWARTWLSDINGLGIQADEDWYLIDVDMASQRIQVDCRFTHADGDIDIALYYDPFGAPLASSESSNDNELIDVEGLGGGMYYIKVYYGNAGNTYDLRWDDFTEDAYEENDMWATAWHPGYNWERTWLSNIDGFGIQADDDWYRIDVDPDAERILVDCQFTHAEGDIDIELYDSSGTHVTGSSSATDDEFIDHAISSGGTYYVRVYKDNGRNAYNLWWDDKSEDTYEENDTPVTAWHPGYNWARRWLSDIDGLGIQADDDWYRIQVAPGAERVQVDCRFTHAEGDIDIGLYDSTETLVEASTSVTDNELIDVAISGGGTYYIKVHFSDVDNAYDLRWDDFAEDAYEDNDTWGTAWHPGYNWERKWLSDIDGFGIQADDDWYRIDVDPGAERIQVDCQFTHAEGDINIVLYDSGGTLLAESNSATDNELIDYAISSGGTYYVRVYSGNAGNIYDLRWDDFSTASTALISGLGETSGGWVEAFAGDYSHEDWLRVGWSAYNSANGEARVATGDIDGDGKDEIVLGLGPVDGNPTIPGGWFELLDENHIHIVWGRVNWSPYNSANGETWPACGDIDGDGVDEVIIGLGSYPTYGGWFEVFDYDGGSLVHKVWGRVNWSPYNSANGETRPACGDIDGDGRDEIIIGLSSYPTYGGWFEIFDYDAGILTHKLWWRINWSPYNSVNGESRPACGDIDGDGRDEIVIGLGSYSTNGGWFEIFDYDAGILTHKLWWRVNWSAYNGANGETRPVCGDIDGDARDEIVVGLGNGGGGYLEVFDDASGGYAHLGWPRVCWSPYYGANGETWPAVKR